MSEAKAPADIFTFVVRLPVSILPCEEVNENAVSCLVHAGSIV